MSKKTLNAGIYPQLNESLLDLAKSGRVTVKKYWHIRIGVHVGPIVAGIIGNHKFCYDIFGDTVNTASRMESSGMEDGINISKELNSIIEPFFQTEFRGSIPAKNKGTLPMYQLHRLRPDFSIDTEGIKPNENFHISIDKL
ncbi:adenylate/guanylate cyclase domain-containing protein [Desulfobacterales bacterium HSG17]|nr:adenylate/guanylate cyclase domain-containing protein [Desulfobacterales bacterium HSG17]